MRIVNRIRNLFQPSPEVPEYAVMVAEDRIVSIVIHRDLMEDAMDDAIPGGTVIESALIADETDYLVEPGEAWFPHPITGEMWYSLPGDFTILGGVT